jgi:predicted DNA-binding ribbon-helix-helix protein
LPRARSTERGAIQNMASEAAEVSPYAVVKRSVSIRGHRTSISLEEAFWTRLKRLAEARGLSVSAAIAEIDAARGAANLSSAIRVVVLEFVDQ